MHSNTETEKDVVRKISGIVLGMAVVGSMINIVAEYGLNKNSILVALLAGAIGGAVCWLAVRSETAAATSDGCSE